MEYAHRQLHPPGLHQQAYGVDMGGGQEANTKTGTLEQVIKSNSYGPVSCNAWRHATTAIHEH